MSRWIAPFMLALAALFGGSAAHAQATTADTVELQVIQPFTILKLADLEFGAFTVLGAGSVTIDRIDASRTVTGGISPMGDYYSPAVFQTRGDPNGTVRVRVPSRNVTLTHDNGTDTIQLRQLATNLPGGRGRRHRLDAEGNLVFQLGARIDIAANQPPGRYTGTFEVETTYQ